MAKKPRIVSLLPSSTEIICALGMQDQLVGISHCCDYPPAIMDLPRVTSTLVDSNAASSDIDVQVSSLLQQQAALYSLNVEKLKTLAPDIIITQAVCDVCAVSATDVVKLSAQLPGNPQIINLEPFSLQDVLQTVSLVANAGGAEQAGHELVAQLQRRIELVANQSRRIAVASRPRVACVDWLAPPFVAGHWMPEMIALAGGVALPAQVDGPSFRCSWQQIAAWRPDIVFIALCGMDMARTRADISQHIDTPQWRESFGTEIRQVYFTDGNALFNRPSQRLLDSLELLANCLHPGRFAATPLPLYKLIDTRLC